MPAIEDSFPYGHFPAAFCRMAASYYAALARAWEETYLRKYSELGGATNERLSRHVPRRFHIHVNCTHPLLSVG